MDASVFSRLLFSTETPLLPGATGMWLAMHAGWAIVLGGGVLLFTGKLAPGYRWSLSLLMMVWTLMPGIASPAYWLGLAFQSPSLMSLAVCPGWVLQRARQRRGLPDLFKQSDLRALNVLLALGIVLGWLLFLDTMAWLPGSLYAWGFGANAFAATLAVAALLWLALGSTVSALPLAVLTLFALSRLPTGNVWDVLLDPWLWLALQARWLLSVARRLSAARRISAATRV
jgi:hypothetical protein